MVVNGASSIALPSNRDGLDRVAGALARLNGVTRYSLLVFRSAEGEEFVDPQTVDEYMQFAGSAERMTIEIRMAHRSGVYRHMILGHQRKDRASGRSESSVSWRGDKYEVFDNEVFESDEAARIAQGYLLKGSVSNEYAQRPI